MKYEYLKVTLSVSIRDSLNVLGQDRWELVSVVAGVDGSLYAFLKRELVQ